MFTQKSLTKVVLLSHCFNQFLKKMSNFDVQNKTLKKHIYRIVNHPRNIGCILKGKVSDGHTVRNAEWIQFLINHDDGRLFVQCGISNSACWKVRKNVFNCSHTRY